MSVCAANSNRPCRRRPGPLGAAALALGLLAALPGAAQTPPLPGQGQADTAILPSAEPASPPGPGADAQPPAAAPLRVLSMNLCTDQLAMLLAAPGQLISVSNLARDPTSSAMVTEALSYPVNHGLAEEIFLLRPDLVLSEPYTKPATVALLRRLGIKVTLIQPVSSLAEVRRALTEVGAALGRADQAQQAVDQFDRALAAYQRPSATAPRAALYHANGYTTGARTLGGDILSAAGLANITEELGLDWGGLLPLEQLILTLPDAVITGQTYPGRSRAEDLLDHPALSQLKGRTASVTARDADWLCGTPHVLRAIASLDGLRQEIQR